MMIGLALLAATMLLLAVALHVGIYFVVRR